MYFWLFIFRMDNISGSFKQSEHCSPISPESTSTTEFQWTNTQILNNAVNHLQSGNIMDVMFNKFEIISFLRHIVCWFESAEFCLPCQPRDFQLSLFLKEERQGFASNPREPTSQVFFKAKNIVSFRTCICLSYRYLSFILTTSRLMSSFAIVVRSRRHMPIFAPLYTTWLFIHLRQCCQL